MHARVTTLVLCLPLLATACANGLAERRAALAPLIGKSETDLVRQLGVPNRTFETGGHRFLAYVEDRTTVLPGVGPIGPFGYPYAGGWVGGYVGSLPPEVLDRVCETTFEVDAGRVTGVTLRGNACD